MKIMSLSSVKNQNNINFGWKLKRKNKKESEESKQKNEYVSISTLTMPTEFLCELPLSVQRDLEKLRISYMADPHIPIQQPHTEYDISI